MNAYGMAFLKRRTLFLKFYRLFRILDFWVPYFLIKNSAITLNLTNHELRKVLANLNRIMMEFRTELG